MGLTVGREIAQSHQQAVSHLATTPNHFSVWVIPASVAVVLAKFHLMEICSTISSNGNFVDLARMFPKMNVQ